KRHRGQAKNTLHALELLFSHMSQNDAVWESIRNTGSEPVSGAGRPQDRKIRCSFHRDGRHGNPENPREMPVLKESSHCFCGNCGMCTFLARNSFPGKVNPGPQKTFSSDFSAR